MNKITYRNLTFYNNDLVEGNCSTQHAMIGESLAYDTLDFKVWCSDPRLDTDFLTSDGKTLITKDSNTFVCLESVPFTSFRPGDPLCYYFDNVLINKFYLSDVKRVGTNLYQFSCVSAIGLLDNSMHPGGIYSGTAITTVLAEIFAGITYTVDPVVESVKLYGWLPYATKRDNLQQITLATGLAIRAKSDGTVNITALSSTNKGTFGANRSAIGGKVEAITPCTAVQVTEHVYQTSTEDITLYDGSFLTEELILFQEPVHSLLITGGTILASGANYARVQGSGAVKLTGKKYIHTIKRITKGTVSGNSKDSVLTIGDATLVTSLNSNALAQKLYDVFSLPSSIKTDVLYGSERPGDVVSVINPYTAIIESACTRKMDITFGSILKASADFLLGYQPSGIITGYKNKVILTSDQTWTVPAGVTEIRAILIGGGDGGQGGLNGAAGERGGRLPTEWAGHQDSGEWWTEAYNGEGGDGGEAGTGGTAGKVLDTGALSVAAGNTFAAVIGVGGTGGTSNGGAGTTGGNTTFGSYSSANGAPMESGYVDLLSGNIYGIKGLPGIAGAKGRGKTNYSEDRYRMFSGEGFSTAYRYNGSFGISYCQYVWRESSSNKKWVYGQGGSGGGASYTGSGSDGTNGSTETNDGWGMADGGNGGNGANAGASQNATILGSGGYGGHGGGGGGGGGGVLNPNGSSYEWPGSAGLGGTGSAGGNGKTGCVIVYY